MEQCAFSIRSSQVASVIPPLRITDPRSGEVSLYLTHFYSRPAIDPVARSSIQPPLISVEVGDT